MHRILHDVPAPIEAIESRGAGGAAAADPALPAPRTPNQRLAVDAGPGARAARDRRRVRRVVELFELAQASPAHGRSSPIAAANRLRWPATARRRCLGGSGPGDLAPRRAPCSRLNEPANPQRKPHEAMSRSRHALAGRSLLWPHASGPAGQTSPMGSDQLQSGAETPELHAPGPLESWGSISRRTGSYLLFTQADSVRPNYKALYQISTLGGKPRKRVFNVDTAPGVARDGKHVAFLRVQTREAPGRSGRDTTYKAVRSGS